ncbi:MAG: F0F1 ATP synthase subunit epsilon [Planctomycetales bacterium]
MNLKILLPHEIFLTEPATKIIAEAVNGSFCLLPRHVDFVAALAPGLLMYVNAAGEEIFLAVDQGTLVKRGDEVLVSTRDAVRGPDLGSLKEIVLERFEAIDEGERAARAAAARLEAGMVRRFMELNPHGS